ncbi:MAG TPA: hypothetical protein VL096_19745, partial [Pirellulaceae bacterium]|nr:hypothetical protein [Pirellulaceae bacterium]
TKSFRADQSHPSNVNDLQLALAEIANNQDGAGRRRIFPLYDTYNANNRTVRLVGFVAAQVLQSDLIDDGQGEQLQVILEPDFFVHFTAETARYINADNAVPLDDVLENLYIHKLRLTR